MKKAFQIFGLALIASSLIFTACKKDEEEDTTNNQQQEQPVSQGTLRLVFDGTTTTQFGYMKGIWSPKNDTVLFRARAAVAWSEDGNITMPYIDCMLSNDEERGWMVRYMEYANLASEVNAVTEYFETFTGNWWYYTLLQGSTISDFDATNVTATYTLLTQMYNAYEYFVEDKDKEEVTIKELDVYADKFKYDRATSK